MALFLHAFVGWALVISKHPSRSGGGSCIDYLHAVLSDDQRRHAVDAAAIEREKLWLFPRHALLNLIKDYAARLRTHCLRGSKT
ncbi:hypothetical protein LTR43_012641, partial [Exophiala xenobiotica]